MEQWQFNRALQASKLKAVTRALLMHMGVLADWPGGVIPDRYSPSLAKLVEITGFSRRAIQEHLNLAEEEGWIKRDRPTTAQALGAGERTTYRLLIPDVQLVPNALGHEAHPPRAPRALGRAPGALGTDQAVVRNAENALGHLLHGGGAPGALGGVRQVPSTISSSISTTTTAAAVAVKGPVRKILQARPDWDLATAEAVLKKILEGREIRNPAAYVASVIAADNLDQYEEEATPPRVYTGPRCDLVLGLDDQTCDSCNLPAGHPAHRSAPAAA
jgi:hypothetical protein